MIVLGVDVFRRGWVGVQLTNGAVSGVFGKPTLAALVELTMATVIGVDIPIGLPHKGQRECDRLAKEAVGIRRNSVFTTPPSAALAAPDHRQATKLAAELTGKGISQQAFALRARINEAAAVADSRIVEVHPEVSFRALAGNELAFSKKTWNGQRDREHLLHQAGIDLPCQLEGPIGSIPVDDVLDAAAAAWSAQRVAEGRAESLPPGATQDASQVIWY